MSAVLTKSRSLNIIKCYASYALSLLGSVHLAHRPLFISVEPASICQLRCPACPVGLRARKPSKEHAFMSQEVWKRVLVEAAPCAHTMQFFFQGEPLLHPLLPQMIAEAHNAGLYTIVSTNAQALTTELAEQLIQSGLNRIIVSMDGMTTESYNAYRIGGDVEKCKKALQSLQSAKKRFKGHTLIELQCLRLKTNENEWGEFKKNYKKLGADRLVLKTAQLYDYAAGHPLMPSNPRYSRYVIGKDGLYHRRKRLHGCFRVWSGAVITTTGEVLPCCYDKEHRYSYGNIMSAPLAELFTNEKAIAFRRAAIKEQPTICKECWR